MATVHISQMMDCVVNMLNTEWKRLCDKHGIQPVLNICNTYDMVQLRVEDMRKVGIWDGVAYPTVIKHWKHEKENGSIMITTCAGYIDSTGQYYYHPRTIVTYNTLYGLINTTKGHPDILYRYLLVSLTHEFGHCIANYKQYGHIRSFDQFMQVFSENAQKYAEECQQFFKLLDEGKVDFDEYYIRIHDEADANKSIGLDIKQIHQVDVEMQHLEESDMVELDGMLAHYKEETK